MKNSIAMKFLAVLLAALTLVGAVVSAAGIALLGWLNLYTVTNYEQWQAEEVQMRSEQLARDMLLRFCIKEYSDIPEEVCMDSLYLYHEWDYEHWIGLVPDTYGYTIADSDGNTRLSDGMTAGASFEFRLTSRYPMDSRKPTGDDVWYYNGAHHGVYYVESPEYTVTVYMTPESLYDYDGLPVAYIDVLFQARYWLIAALGSCMVVFAACAVYLCYVAGRSRGSDVIAPGALNKIPLDIYLAAAAGICIGLVGLTVFILEEWVLQDSLNVGGLALATLVMLVIATVVIGFFFALAAQAKMGKTWWLRHTLIGTLCILLFKLVRFICRAIGKLFSLMPMIWQYILTCIAAGFGLSFALLILFNNDTGAAAFFLIHTILGCIAIIGYGGYALGTILRGAKRMRQGDLTHKINTRFLVGSYKKGAEDLNALADAAKLAAEQQLKSERMKTELITNVSHDIKTPLTSIINYVDLLEKPHTEAEQQQYLEVLSRQSQRLKKLIEDLMDMSKATTGNMNVEITRLDAAETVNQALGEFADKLTAAALTPVFRQPENPVYMNADGRLVWRVLSNLLSNTVKYALPGTRVYIDVCQGREEVQISLKNISREPLNISAEELTERFVRGDVSRNTEGSGLGLNIAQSLMELQKGRLELLVDGDLFKVTLTFPAETIWVVGKE